MPAATQIAFCPEVEHPLGRTHVTNAGKPTLVLRVQLTSAVASAVPMQNPSALQPPETQSAALVQPWAYGGMRHAPAEHTPWKPSSRMQLKPLGLNGLQPH